MLARLDDTQQRAALAQAEAQLQSARALLVQYQSQLAQDQRDVKRAEDLVQRKLVSEQAVEQARTLVETQSAPVGKPAPADRPGSGQCPLRAGATRLLH